MRTVSLHVRVDGFTQFLNVSYPISSEEVCAALDKKLGIQNGRWDFNYKKGGSIIVIENEQMLQDFYDNRIGLGLHSLEAKRLEPPSPSSSSSSSSMEVNYPSLNATGDQSMSSQIQIPPPERAAPLPPSTRSSALESEVLSLRRDLADTIEACKAEKQMNLKTFQEARLIIEAQGNVINRLQEALDQMNGRLQSMEEKVSTSEKYFLALQSSTTKTVPSENSMSDQRVKALQRKMVDYVKRDELLEVVSEKTEEVCSRLIKRINQRDVQHPSSSSSTSSSSQDLDSQHQREGQEDTPMDNSMRENKREIIAGVERQLNNCVTRIDSILAGSNPQPPVKNQSASNTNPGKTSALSSSGSSTPTPSPTPVVPPPRRSRRVYPEDANLQMVARFERYCEFCDEAQHEQLWRLVTQSSAKTDEEFERDFAQF